MSEDLKAIARRFFDGINSGNLSVIDEFVAEDIVEHEEMPPGFASGREGVHQFFQMVRGGFPDLKLTTELMIAEADTLSVLVTMNGTHRGEFMGIPATGKQISVPVSDILRFEGGKIVEHWGVMDSGMMMQQLGVGGPS